MSFPMTFAEAASRQHLYHSYYTVWLVSPTGEREYLNFTARKTGTGLMKILRLNSVQDRIKQFPDAETLTLKKRADRLELSNGWQIKFGGTIRQEASELS